MKTHYLYLILACALMSCQSKSKISITQDFEQAAGWSEMSTLTKGKGHSGLYFSRTGPGIEYGQTYVSRLGDISEKRIHRIDMGAWIRINDPAAKARLVLSIDSPDSTVYWQALDTQDASPTPGEWTRLYFTYDLPDGFLPDYNIKVFLWNVSNKEVDADDFDIHFYTK